MKKADGVSPTKNTYSVLIDGCCQRNSGQGSVAS
ncbi:BnaC01g35280D [Brassica napus]|uniref:BnaC01g35280D protein n=1 Tax=Brassica napus TaxID=3708 RepID=A0A078GUP0_BRANA|nr:BnaC01g35280D [Brassica napus]